MTNLPPNTFSLPLHGRALMNTRFVARPNRFLVVCEDQKGTRINAFMPNPGRLQELLLPDVRLFLINNGEVGDRRATAHTVLAVEQDGRPVLLHTHWCNIMARQLLDAKLVPGLDGMRVVRQEVKVGHSRFDFLLEDKAGLCYVEVKSCTLFGNGVAMFPDAVTARGRRHLLELAEIAATGAARCRVLFVVQTDRAHSFMPDYHTDPAFADAMLVVRGHVPIIPLPVAWDKHLRFRVAGAPLPIPWERIEQENHDRGAYLLLLRLDTPRVVEVGALGALSFAPGWYVYVGSAMKGLQARIARHKRLRKQKRWHIDYLRDAAEMEECLPIRASRRMECDLARDVRAHAPTEIAGFGCSDCGCNSHLLHVNENPLQQAWFHTLLQRYRTAP